MKRFCLRLLLFACTFIGFNAALTLLVPTDKNHYLLAYADKMKRLQATSPPRIVIIGGSNTAFGIDSRLIAQATSMEVVNMGLHAGIGIRFSLDESLPYIKPGDIVVLQIEYGNFFSGGNGEPETLPLLLNAIGWENARRMNAAQLRNVTAGIPQVAWTNLKRLAKWPITHTLDTQPRTDKFVYTRSGFNAYGDEVSHLRFSNQPANPGTATTHQTVDKEFIHYLKHTISLYEKRGARVIILPPASSQANFRLHYNSHIGEALESIGHAYAKPPEQMTVPDSCAFDTGYHLNQTGTRINTLRIANTLVPHLDKKFYTGAR